MLMNREVACSFQTMECYFLCRIMYVGLKIIRPPDSVARYKMIRHAKRKPSDWRKRYKQQHVELPSLSLFVLALKYMPVI